MRNGGCAAHSAFTGTRRLCNSRNRKGLRSLEGQAVDPFGDRLDQTVGDQPVQRAGPLHRLVPHPVQHGLLHRPGRLPQHRQQPAAHLPVGARVALAAPRRAVVSAIRRPATAVMLATTSGIVAPDPSEVLRSTSKRDATSDRAGTMNTSS